MGWSKPNGSATEVRPWAPWRSSPHGDGSQGGASDGRRGEGGAGCLGPVGHPHPGGPRGCRTARRPSKTNSSPSHCDSSEASGRGRAGTGARPPPLLRPKPGTFPHILQWEGRSVTPRAGDKRERVPQTRSLMRAPPGSPWEAGSGGGKGGTWGLRGSGEGDRGSLCSLVPRRGGCLPLGGEPSGPVGGRNFLEILQDAAVQLADVTEAGVGLP